MLFSNDVERSDLFKCGWVCSYYSKNDHQLGPSQLGLKVHCIPRDPTQGVSSSLYRCYLPETPWILSFSKVCDATHVGDH